MSYVKSKTIAVLFFISLLLIFAQEPTENNWTEKVKSFLFSDKRTNSTQKIITIVSKSDLETRLKGLDSKEFSYEYNTTNHGYVEKYLRMGNYFGKIIGMSEYYFPLFDEVFKRYNIPKDMKYLAVVESKLTVKVTSKAGAKGLWQFMPATGKAFGLENNMYVDERHDPIKSTEAAAKYFLLLYKYFGSWEMVMAAYNCGEGNVKKAIARSGGKKTYWEIRNFLPLETRGYVPSFIAASYMLNYHEKHYVKSQKFKYSYLDTDTLVVKKKLVLENLSKKLGMTLEEINFLNPQYKIGVIPKVAGKKYYLRLPKDKYLFYKKNESFIDRVTPTQPSLKKSLDENVLNIKEPVIVKEENSLK